MRAVFCRICLMRCLLFDALPLFLAAEIPTCTRQNSAMKTSHLMSGTPGQLVIPGIIVCLYTVMAVSIGSGLS